MQARRVINFYSNDMLILFKVQLGNRNLIEAVIAKLAKLYNLAVFAKIEEFDKQIISLIEEVSKDLRRIQSLTQKHFINEKNTKFIVLRTQEFTFGNHTIFGLLRLIEISDLYFTYINIAKSAALFNKLEANSLLKIKRKKLFSLLSNIATISLKNYA